MKTPLTFLQGIVTVIVFSIIGLIVLIVFSQSLDFGLVEKNYYEKDLKYQDQIDRIERTNGLSESVKIEQTSSFVKIEFPSSLLSPDIEGEIHLFRPSNSKIDKIIPLKLDKNGNQSINSNELENGAWIVKLNWIHKNLEYYKEKRIFINS